MAAYAALVSVMQILDQLERHPSPPIFIDKQQVESITQIVTFFQEFLEGYHSPFAYSDEADPLEMRIADAAYAAEDVIESHIVDAIHLRKHPSWSRLIFTFLGHNDINRWINFCQDLQQMIEDMGSVKKEVMEMMKREETGVQAHQPERNMFRSSSLTGTGKNSSIMVGFDDALLQLLDNLTGGPRCRQVIPITGMGGIGKTTLARTVFENALTKESFDVCAWVTISQQYNTREVICQILSNGHMISEKNEHELGEELYKYMFGRTYLVILDDIWSIDVWEKIKTFLPDCNNQRSRIIVTTRLSYLTSQLTNYYALGMEFLDEVNSWNLFCTTVFGEVTRFPLELEEIGKKIVKHCRGLPLSVVVIGGVLAKSQHTQEHWEHIEQQLSSVVNSKNDDYCLKILKLSYNHLPACLKPCFLYMGIFEEDAIISVSNVIHLWVSEGFLKPEKDKSLETIGREFLKDLIDRNLILVDRLGCTGNIKYCKMHDLLRDLCLKEGEKERFYHVIGKRISRQGIHNRRRLFYPQRCSNERVESMSNVRSLTSQDYEVGGLQKFRLLRILNSYDTYRGKGAQYSFNGVIHELVNSRYLAFKASYRNAKPSSSVSFLWNLHTLHYFGEIGFPVEIWKMSQLRHVYFRRFGAYLPDPPSCSINSRVVLENLQTLKKINNFKFGEEVVCIIPNIKRLKIAYDEIENDDYYCLRNVERLCKLESFTMFNLFRETTASLIQHLRFPKSLKKLYLECSGDSRLRWEEVLEKIGSSSPLLQKLKLLVGVFTTGKWETIEGQFPNLKFLGLSCCRGLKEWMIEESSHFPCLEKLRVDKLYQLEEIPSEIGNIPTLVTV